VVPIYKTKLSYVETLTLKKNLEILNCQYKICLIGPYKLACVLEVILKDIPSGSIELFEDKYFSGVEGYDRLLRTKEFYLRFDEYEFMLIAQTDAIILKNTLNYWIEKGYSYIGAPCKVGDPKSSSDELIWVGNGGLSLRRIEDSIRCLKGWKYLLAPDTLVNRDNILRKFINKYSFGFNKFLFRKKTHEDFFWSVLIDNNFKEYKVASVGDATLFSLEYNYQEEIFLNNKIPFGVHAWEKNGNDEAKEILKKYLLSNKKEFKLSE
jgi:Protein of unknown function (DUF5672)